MWFSSLLSIISAALSIWANKEKRKYIDEKMEIEKEYYAEINKPRGERNNAILDNLEQRLRILASAISADIAKQNP